MANDKQGKIIDLSHILTLKAQKSLRAIKLRHDQIRDISTANQDALTRTHHAALLLAAATSPAEICTVVSEHFPAILDIAAARLFAPSSSEVSAMDGIATADRRDISSACDKTGFFLGAPLAHHAPLFAASGIKTLPPSMALARLPEDLPFGGEALLLMLCGKTTSSFIASQETNLLDFLAAMIGIVLAARDDT